MFNKLYISIIFVLVGTIVLALDHQFKQFYATPLFLSPAFTGLTYEHRFTANYRNQWPGVKTAYTTYMATYDYNVSNMNSGVGGFILQNALAANKVSYFDMGHGALFNSTNFWFGFTGRHLNKPNVNIVGNMAPLPVSVSIHEGYRFYIIARGSGKTKFEEFVRASFNLRYRSLRIKKYRSGYPNHENLALLVGLEVSDKNFRVAYS